MTTQKHESNKVPTDVIDGLTTCHCNTLCAHGKLLTKLIEKTTA